MGPHGYLNLRKLATGAFGQYTNELHMGLETELYHLRNLGYVDLKQQWLQRRIEASRSETRAVGGNFGGNREILN